MRCIFYLVSFLMLLASCTKKKSTYQLLQLETEQSSKLIHEAFLACDNQHIRYGPNSNTDVFFNKLDSLSAEIQKRTVAGESCENWKGDVSMLTSQIKSRIAHHPFLDSLLLLMENGCEMSYLKRRQELLYCCFSAVRLDNEKKLFGDFLDRRNLKALPCDLKEESGIFTAKLAVNGFCAPIYRCINTDTVFVNKELRISPLKFYPDNRIYELSLVHLRSGKYDVKGTMFFNTGINYAELPFEFSFNKK